MIRYLTILCCCTGLLILHTVVTDLFIERLWRALARQHRSEAPMPRPVKKADEYDLVTGWRRLLSGFQRTGTTSRIKRRLRRRYRRDDKAALRSNPEEQ